MSGLVGLSDETSFGFCEDRRYPDSAARSFYSYLFDYVDAISGLPFFITNLEYPELVISDAKWSYSSERRLNIAKRHLAFGVSYHFFTRITFFSRLEVKLGRRDFSLDDRGIALCCVVEIHAWAMLEAIWCAR